MAISCFRSGVCGVYHCWGAARGMRRVVLLYGLVFVIFEVLAAILDYFWKM